MAIKLSPSSICKRIPIWVISTSYSSSNSCAASLETTTETTFEEKTRQVTRNKLIADNLIRVLDNTSDLSTAVKLFKGASRQTRFRHTPETYYRIIRKLGLAGIVEEMEGFCQNMVREKLPGTKEALLALIGEFVEQCQPSEALSVLVIMNSGGYSPSIGTINALMRALVKEKREFRDVLLVYKEMVKARISPSVETLNCLLVALVDSDRLEAALNQYKRMEKKGCSPNSKSFEIIVEGLFAKNRVDEAICILREMFELGLKKFDPSFFRAVVPLVCRENRPSEGIRLFQMMRDCQFELDYSTCTALLGCFCKNLLRDEAIFVLEDALKAGLEPPVEAVVDLIDMFCGSGKVDEAAKFLEEKGILETQPYNALLEGCYRAREFSLAMEILRRMSEFNIDDCNSWNVLIRWVCERQGIKKGSELLSRMVVSSIVPNSDTYSALVLGNSDSRKLESALKLLRRIKTNSWVLDPISYTKLVEALCCSPRSVHEAVELLHYMSRKGSSLGSSSFNLLIDAVCNTGKLGEATELCRLAYYSSDTSLDGSLYTTIMRGLSRERRPRDAIAVLSRMLVSGTHLDAEAYCVAFEVTSSMKNQAGDCVSLFNAMVDEGVEPNSERLLWMVSRVADHCRLRRILGSIAKLVPRGVMDSAVYNVLIQGLWKEGERDEARRLLDAMLDKGWVPDPETHQLLIGSDGLGSISGNFSTGDEISDILVEGFDDL